MLISVRKHVIVYEYEEAYVLRGLLHYYSDQKFLIEKTKMRNHKTGTLLLSSTSREEPRGLRGQLPDAPDPEVPGREGQLWKDVGTEMLISARKLVIYFRNEEAYVVYDGCLAFTSDQKFLVEEAGMRKSLGDFPVQDPVRASQRSTWIT